MSDGNVLTLENISHAYGKTQVLEGVNIAVAPGEFMCLLGPSGCGKTTTLRLVAGLEELQAGRILINGEPVADARNHVPPERRGVGLVFQEAALFPHLSVLGNVTFGLAGMGRAEAQLRAREVLDQVGMADYGDAYPHVLSGGQQKRVALARALAPKPKLMLFDEPFAGLDAQLRSQIRDETLHLMKDSGTTILLVTHDPEEAMYMADRIAIIHEGRIAQVGAPVELYRQPTSAFVTSFFSSVNRLEGVVKGNAISTPFGPIAAGDLRDGAAVEVLIRPEAIRISRVGDENAGTEEGYRGHVITTRALRRGNFIHLCLGDFEDTHHHFHSRVPSRFVLKEGENISVRLDPDQTFVFPVEG